MAMNGSCSEKPAGSLPGQGKQGQGKQGHGQGQGCEAAARELFRALDGGGSGRMTRDQFVRGLSGAHGTTTSSPPLCLPPAEADHLFNSIDREGTGCVDFAQFVEVSITTDFNTVCTLLT
jgi:hypothetical protein